MLNEETAALLPTVAKFADKPFSKMSVAEARTVFDRMMSSMPAYPVALSVTERSISMRDGFQNTLRFYNATPNASTPRSVLIFIHGGAFVSCDLDTHDRSCRELAHKSGFLVVSVNYRLAPENPFPTGLYDCYDATVWIAENITEFGGNKDDLFIAGDSAGGNLAIGVTHLLRDNDGPRLRGQVIIYPVAGSADKPSESMLKHKVFVSLEDVLWWTEHYSSSQDDRNSPLFCPLYQSNFSNLPPALIITAELDPLCDDGEAYADAMAAAGVNVTKRRYDGTIHGFMLFAPMLSQANDAFNFSAEWLLEQSNSVRNAL